MSGTELTEEHLLLDFRPLEPKAIARLRCDGIVDPLGLCTAEESRWKPKYQLECAWQADRDDFLCEASVEEPYPWVRRVFHSSFTLRGARAARSDEPPTLSEFLRRVEQDACWARRALSLPEGVVHHIALLPGRPGLPPLHLFGTTEGCVDFDMRFFVGTLRAGGAELQEILPSGGLDSDELAGNDERFDSCSGATDFSEDRWNEEASTLTHSIRILYDDRPKLLAVEVVVSEGTGRGVFWIGVEESTGTLRSDVRRLATTAQSRGYCGTLAYPASAVVMNSAPGRFAVRLDIEPRWIEPGYGTRRFEYLPDRCPIIAVLTWEPGKGFAANRSPGSCSSLGPRRVEIDELGRSQFRRVPGD